MKKIIMMLALCLAVFTSCAPRVPAKKEVGLQLYSIRQQINEDLNASLDAVVAAGYTTVEMANYNANEGKFYGMAPEDFKALCNQKGLEILSSHINGPDPNVTSIEECDAWWRKAIEDHKKVGVKYIVQPSMRRSAYNDRDSLFTYCVLFNRVGEMCNQAGIRFGYHNHNMEFSTKFDGIPVYDIMMEVCEPKNVFFEIDVYWCQVGGANVAEYLAKYPGRYELWHVKDVKEIGASGTMDFEPIFANAEVSGMKYQIVEQEAFDLPPYESIKASFDFLQNAPYVKESYSKEK